ncbi:MAG: aminotransferase class I/II-fold pyridoxal phosphate-dependent enzyme [Planctomycetota bacterium]
MTARADLDASARALVGVLAEAGRARAPTGATEGVDLVTNDVLALRRDPRVVGAAVAALRRAGLGAGGSRLLGGDDPAHRALEEEAAAWTGAEAALLYPTGTAANHGLVAGLVDRSDLVVAERENHGSLVEAVRSARARTLVVHRGDLGALDRALGMGGPRGRRFVVLESLHGMDGDAADLAAVAAVARRRDALLLVDEAHAVGLLGPRGAGLADPASVGDVLAARTLPCGKALAGAGGLVVASRAVVDLLVHRSRAFAFTTGLPPAVAAGTLAALRIARDEPARAARARAAARRVEGRLRALGQSVAAVDGAFVPWILGRDDRALEAASALRARGFAVRAVRPPTVPEGTARVRLSCHADLGERDLARLERALEVVVR